MHHVKQSFGTTYANGYRALSGTLVVGKGAHGKGPHHMSGVWAWPGCRRGEVIPKAK